MTSRNLPRKTKSPIKAIREQCIECMGGRKSCQNYRELIRECPATLCPLYVFRFGVNPYNRKNISGEQKKSRLANLNSPTIPQESWQNRS